MSELPAADDWSQEQYRKLQPRWLPLLLIAGGSLVCGFLAHGPSPLRLQIAIITLAVGLGLIVSSFFYLIAEKRRAAETRRWVDTLRREAADRKEKEKRYRILIENAPDAILMLNTQGLVASLNPAAETLFGRPRQELLLTHLGDVVHPDDRARVSAQLHAANDARKPFTIETRVAGTSGEPMFVELAVQPHLNDGRVAALIAIGRDVTGRRKSEAGNEALQVQLRRAQKMEALGRLAGGITHDFNNFLTIILVNCQMARMDLVHGHPAIESLEQISEASQRAAGMVRQILSFTRHQADEHQVLDLESIVRDGLKLLRSILPAIVHLEPRLEVNCPKVEVNVEQIHQVLLNLGTNAAHAMRKAGGVLEISLTSLSVDQTLALQNPELHTGKYARLTVRDNGHGMDAATVERIFDPFFTTKADSEGTGLGLAIVQNIVKNHGGAITVQSEPGRGTTFELYFPAADGEETDLVPESGLLPPGDDRHVLLVEHDAPVVESGRRLIERLGYRVSVCTDAAAALSLFRSNTVDVDCVLCDLAMPGMTGVELADEFRRHRAGVPFILMSGNPSLLPDDPLPLLGICAFVAKPFSLRTLAETLHRARAGQ